MAEPTLIEITDEFTQPTGQWINYATVPASTEEEVRDQKHVNIRSFEVDRRGSEVTMFTMDRYGMYELDGKELSGFTKDLLPPARLYIEGSENWSFGTVERQADRNNWGGITMTCKANVETLSQSVIKV